MIRRTVLVGIIQLIEIARGGVQTVLCVVRLTRNIAAKNGGAPYEAARGN
jgi:hypothetical protein